MAGAVSFPSARSLGGELVEQKSNEIPAARALLQKLGPLDGKIVMRDALQANQVTLRTITQDHGADYLLPVKDNHPALHHAAAQSFPALTPGAFPPPEWPRRRALPPQVRQSIATGKKPASCAGWGRRRKSSAVSGRTRWWP